MPQLPALAVDVNGLAKLVERRGKSFAILELVQNAWDEAVENVAVNLSYDGYNKATLMVLDDSPDGFHDLSHAYTLFAESKKKSDPTKRGRFNLGEKLVIALADSFAVSTTTGGVVIDVKKNERKVVRKSRDGGSLIAATLRMTKAEVEEAENAFYSLIPPAGITTTLNGQELPARKPIATFTATLQTEIADEEGYLRPTKRQTLVEVYEPLPATLAMPAEKASIYELGIPVVATGDTYHINVLQKVPLNSDRDNVTPAYLRDLRALVLNEMANRMDSEQASSTWINDALEDELVAPEAVEQILTKRFGDKRVIYDPSDPEANKIAMSEGYTVIPGRAFSSSAWKNIKIGVKPAGQVTPSPKPYSPDGEPLQFIPTEKWTKGMWHVSNFAHACAIALLGHPTETRFTSDIAWQFAATYGQTGILVFNKAKLGNAFFDNGITDGVIDLIIHEFGHEYESDHLSRRYIDALTKLGAKMARLALEKPQIFA